MKDYLAKGILLLLVIGYFAAWGFAIYHSTAACIIGAGLVVLALVIWALDRASRMVP